MRKAELEVGGDYAVAHHTHSPEAAIIRVTDLGPRAVVRAKVLDPGGRETTPLGWRKGQAVEVSLQRITCTADEWSAVAAERKARAAEVEAEWERRQQEEWVEAAADPTRTLPESYTGISRIAADQDYVELIGSTVDRRWGPRRLSRA